MRVWLAPSRYAPHVGGIETVVAQLAQELRSAGDQVLVLTHRHPAHLPEEEVVDGQRVRRLRFEAPSREVGAAVDFLHNCLRVRRALESLERPDAIHIHGAASQTLHLVRYARAQDVPLVLTTHGEITGDANDIYGRSAYIRACFRYACRAAVAVTAPSQETLAEAQALAPAATVRSTVVPNGIAPEVWGSAGTAPASQTVLAWGRLEQQKGFDRLVDCWPTVRAMLPEAQLLVVGDGSQSTALAARVGPGVQLLGGLTQTQIAHQARTAQVAAVPSRIEAFGMSAWEALAAGRMVLHAGIPVVRRIVGKYGWVTPHDDPVALGRAVVDILRSPALTVPRSAVAEYDRAAVAQAYRTLYASGSA